MSVQLDHIRPDDLEFLRHLRNAERRWFFDATEISPEAQAGWFASMAADDRTKWYLVRVDGQPAGCFSVRLTDPTSAEVRGILLAEQFRGRGVMTRAIGEAMERLGPHLRYFAEVLPHNEESLQLFERLGFERKFVVMERAAR